jgi:hypothetical protein
MIIADPTVFFNDRDLRDQVAAYAVDGSELVVVDEVPVDDMPGVKTTNGFLDPNAFIDDTEERCHAEFPTVGAFGRSILLDSWCELYGITFREDLYKVLLPIEII